MIKVKIEFRDGSIKEFWAMSSFETSNDGRIVFWDVRRNEDEKSKLKFYSVDIIFGIEENEE